MILLDDSSELSEVPCLKKRALFVRQMVGAVNIRSRGSRRRFGNTTARTNQSS
jgi:hypothetical protein